MGVFVKICGVRTFHDAEQVSALSPEAIGHIFWPGSKRYVEPEIVAAWRKDLPAGILRVGVFVDASTDEIQRAVDTAELDIIQLHGSEPPAFCGELPYRKWKVLRLDASGHELEAYSVDAFLIDSYSVDSPGGTGETLDWARAREFVEEQSVRVILAGGLAPENVAAAIREVSPWGVDVCSGVEKQPGVKDLGKVREFIEICRR